MTLETDFEWLELSLAAPFTISRGTRETAGCVAVRIEDESGQVGIGASAPSAYFGETRRTVEEVLPDLLAAVEAVGDPHQRQRVESRTCEIAGGTAEHAAARAAVNGALLDLCCRRVDLPLYRYWGLDPERTLATSFTISIDDPDRMAERAGAAAETYDVLKLKLGTDPDRDEARVAAVRAAAPEATLRVDANGGWEPAAAIALTDALADHGVEFVEQPVAADDPAGLARVAGASPLPIAADESCVTARDVPAVAEWADVVVAKLAKCGGPAAARRLIHVARAHDLDVMLGCMTESAAAIAPAAHLAPLADYADLDGALLLADDPYEGVPVTDGRVDLAALDQPGTGARRA
ncbi:MAG: dipeptide epimerase [Haloarculaceae archaeon]